MDDKKKCGGCLWKDTCTFETPCSFYSNGYEDDMSDAQIAAYIEERRAEFYREWANYISQYE